MFSTGLPEPVGAGVFGLSRNFHPAPASTDTVEIFKIYHLNIFSLL